MSAQTAYLDSLKNIIKQQRSNDTARFKLLYGYAQHYYGQAEADSADNYIEQAFSLASQMKYADGLADYHHFKAVSNKNRQILDSAMFYAREELKWGLQANDKNKLAYAYNDIGNMHIYFGNGDSAVINFLNGLSVAEKSNNRRLAANILFNLSAAYNMIDNYKASRNYAKK